MSQGTGAPAQDWGVQGTRKYPRFLASTRSGGMGPWVKVWWSGFLSSPGP